MSTTLTHAEAAARSDLLTVHGYAVSLDLTGLARGDSYTATTRVEFDAGAAGASTFIDLIAHQVESVELNGQALDLDSCVEVERVALPGLQMSNVLVIRSRHQETGRNYGLRRSVDPADGQVYVWSHCEPQHARRIFACFDQPDLKAPIALTVQAPPSWTCIANGEVANVSVDTGGSQRWDFAATPPLSTYLFALCAGPYLVRSSTRDGLTLNVYARQSRRAALDTQGPAILKLTRKALAYYGKAFGLPYPMATLDQVFIPDFPSAMENFGCITYGDGTFLADAPTPAQDLLRSRAQLHEIAHLWFGDIVTMRWWDGLWLKEAFANLAASLALPVVLDGADGWTAFALGTEAIAYAADRSPISHPIQEPIPDVAAAETAFDAITYDKGLAALRQLVARIGQEAFFSGMRRYFAAHAYRTADLDDLLSALGAECGDDLHAWAQGWIGQPGFDALTLAIDDADDVGDVANLGEAQWVSVEATGPAGSTRSHMVAVGHYRVDGDGLRRIDQQVVDVSVGQAASVTLASLQPDDLVLLNDDDLTFASVRLDEQSRRNLITHGGLLPTPISRAVALLIVWDRLAENDLAVADAVGLVLGLLVEEEDPGRTHSLVTAAIEMLRVYAPPAQSAALEERFCNACLTVLDDVDNPGRRLALSIGAAATAVTTEQRASVDLLLAQRAEIDAAHWAAVERNCALGEAGGAEIAALVDRSALPDATSRAARARAALPTVEAKTRALDAMLTGEIAVGLDTYGVALWQRHQDSLLVPFAQRYLSALPDCVAELGQDTAARIASFAFPSSGIDAAFLDRADALATSGDLPRRVSTPLRLRIDRLRRGLAVRSGQAHPTAAE